MAGAKSNLIFRIISDIILLIGVLAMPFWFVSILALAGLIYFKKFYEFIAVFALRDLLYAVPENRFFGSVFVLTIASIIIFYAVDFIKNKIFLY